MSFDIPNLKHLDLSHKGTIGNTTCTGRLYDTDRLKYKPPSSDVIEDKNISHTKKPKTLKGDNKTTNKDCHRQEMQAF